MDKKVLFWEISLMVRRLLPCYRDYKSSNCQLYFKRYKVKGIYECFADSFFIRYKKGLGVQIPAMRSNLFRFQKDRHHCKTIRHLCCFCSSLPAVKSSIINTEARCESEKDFHFYPAR